MVRVLRNGAVTTTSARGGGRGNDLRGKLSGGGGGGGGGRGGTGGTGGRGGGATGARRVVTVAGRGGGRGGAGTQKVVGEILRGLSLGKYVGLFAAEEIDVAALRALTDKDLQSLGIPLGPRKKILSARF